MNSYYSLWSWIFFFKKLVIIWMNGFERNYSPKQSLSDNKHKTRAFPTICWSLCSDHILADLKERPNSRSGRYYQCWYGIPFEAKLRHVLAIKRRAYGSCQRPLNDNICAKFQYEMCISGCAALLWCDGRWLALTLCLETLCSVCLLKNAFW